MTTKFNVGEDTYIRVKVVGIGITKDRTIYDVRVDSEDGTQTLGFKEEDIVKKED